MGNSLGAEIELAQEIRSNCNQNGEEIEAEKSAEIFQELALICKNKSPDPIYLIQGVALLNAALVRQPQSVKIQNDLNQLCGHVLNVVCAKPNHFSLTNISEQAAIKVKAMRAETCVALSKINLIEEEPESIRNLKSMEGKFSKEIELLQNRISQQYADVMDYISKKCVKMLGSPPCGFALIGVGSLASKEINPYSDFKNIIVLEDGIEKRSKYGICLEYYRWYAAIFEMILLNLKETPLSEAGISVLNNFSIKGGNWFVDKVGLVCKGVRFKGLMPYGSKAPFERNNIKEKLSKCCEQVKPIYEMVTLLSQSKDIKTSFHLADVTCRFCFVSGDKKVYNSFLKAAKEKVQAGITCNRYQNYIRKKYYDQLDSLNIQYYFLTNYDTLNVNDVVYHIFPYFVSAMGRINKCMKTSIFDIVRELRDKGVFDDETCRLMLFATAISCLAKLKACLKKDDLENEGKLAVQCSAAGTRSNDQLVEYVGEFCLIRYFEVICGLLTRMNDRNWKISGEKIMKHKMYVLNILHMYDRVPIEYKRSLESTSSSQIGERLAFCTHLTFAYFCDQKYEDALSVLEEAIANYPEILCQKYSIYEQKGKCLYKLKRYSEALTWLEKSTVFKKLGSRLPRTRTFRADLYEIVFFHGLSKLHLRCYSESLHSFVKALTYANQFEDRLLLQKADCKANIGNCFLGLGKIEHAKRKVTQALDLYRRINAPCIRICSCHNTLGLCYMEEKKYRNALDQFKTDYYLRLRTSMDRVDDQLQGGMSLIHLASSMMKKEEAKNITK